MWYLSVCVHPQLIGSDVRIQRVVKVDRSKHKVLGRMKSTNQLKTNRTIALVGLMGAGKSAIGRRLGVRLGLEFVDADVEIEASAGKTITEMFELHGEATFRKCERRVIRRLLAGPVSVLATGGGAFIDSKTRFLIREQALSIWLRADLETLYRRVLRRDDRPLLAAGDPRKILATLIEGRYPIYGLADIVVDSADGSRDEMVNRVITGITEYNRLHRMKSDSYVRAKEALE
ncbi:MAG: Shikimate kinase 1 [Alphaproteobacteria bacterium MarineAlpha9_Bin7]|nr:MAG: Shikimate kinase 1 [Alphaproteobacteria bacterium MarineAlpha9_Bin7]